MTEIDGIRNHHWDTERVIIFQTVILKNISQVSGSRNICDQIYSRLDLCNKSAYDELVNDYYRATEEALGNKRVTITQEKRHCTFSNLVLRGKFRKAVHFSYKGETGGGGGLLPNKWATDRTGPTDVLAGKHTPDKKHFVLHWKRTR